MKYLVTFEAVIEVEAESENEAEAKAAYEVTLDDLNLVEATEV